MASVHKRKESPFFVACFTDRDGRQLKRSTKSTDKKQAIAMANEWERLEQQSRKGLVTAVQLTKVISDISERVTGDEFSIPSVREYFKGWLDGIKAKNAPATLERYQNTVTLFLEGLGPKADKPLTVVTPLDIEAYSNRRLNSGSASKTVLVDIKTLNTAFLRAENYGMIIRNPVKAVTKPKAESCEREVFTQDEILKLLHAAPDPEWQTLILLGYFTGARLGDCVQMQWENIHPDDGLIIYEQRKTKKKVHVPMHLHVMEHLNRMAEFSTTGYLCPKLVNRGTGGKHGLSESFKRIVKKAGIDPMTIDGKGTRKFTQKSFHSLRHSFNSVLANAGVSEEVRMKLTGHTTRVMNKHYTHLEVETLRNAMNTVPMLSAKK